MDSKGSRITDPVVLERVKSLAIPPNWKRVWICRQEYGHIQATGIDDRLRKQYIYHTLWTEARSRVKYDRLYEFGRGLSKLKMRLERDFRRENLDLRFISALAIGIIRDTSIRPGNAYYSRSNGSYGLTTLQKEHVVAQNGRIFFRFVGKKGILQDRCCKKIVLCHLIERVRSVSGRQFLQYLDDTGKKRPLRPAHLNDYLCEVYGGDVTCKTIRTWNACFMSLEYLLNAGQEKLRTERPQ